MKNGRINERNIGHSKLDCSAKRRKTKKDFGLSYDDALLTRVILQRVFDAMEFDEALSTKGHLHEDAMFTDGGRITIAMNRAQFEQLSDIIQKL